MKRPALSRWSALLLIAVVTVFAGGARAHSVDAATLHLTEVAEGKFAIEWQTSALTLRDLEQPAVYPEHCQRRGLLLDCAPLGLVGGIALPWLEGGESRVTVVIDWLSGKRLIRLVGGGAPRFNVYGVAPAAGLAFLGPIASDYTRLGIEHILTGFDHLLFVLSITLLVSGNRALIAAITAFTVAHSITLASSALGWWRLPVAPVETLIALSIVLACAECFRPGPTLARSRPWLLTFAFGLLHGMGFASALLENGLPERHAPSALLFFNLGVEVGQLAAITVFILARWLFAQRERRPTWLRPALVYVMGCTAAYWSLERGLEMWRSL